MVLLVPMVLAVFGATVPQLRDLAIFSIALAVMFAGGIPYLFFVVCALYWSIKNGDAKHTTAFALSPFVFGLVCFVFGLVQAYTDLPQPPPLFVALGVASTFAVFGCVISALYSWAALGIWCLIFAVRQSS